MCLLSWHIFNDRWFRRRLCPGLRTAQGKSEFPSSNINRRIRQTIIFSTLSNKDIHTVGNVCKFRFHFFLFLTTPHLVSWQLWSESGYAFIRANKHTASPKMRQLLIFSSFRPIQFTRWMVITYKFWQCRKFDVYFIWRPSPSLRLAFYRSFF